MANQNTQAPLDNSPVEGHGHIHGEDHFQARTLGGIALVLIALALAFPLFVWISAATHG